MIIRGGTGFLKAIRLFFRKNWIAIVMVLTIELALAIVPTLDADFETTVFSAGIVAMLATVVGIFLGFRFNEAYGRWWEARMLWGQMVNTSRKFGRQVTTLLTSNRLPGLETAEDEQGLHRELLYRHIAFTNALRLSLRRQDTWHEIEPFLAKEEFEKLRHVANIPTQLIQHQAARLGGLLRGSTSRKMLLLQFDNTLNELYDVQGGCERIKNTAFPDAVASSSRVLVWGTVFLIPFGFLEPNRYIYSFELVVVLFVAISFLMVQQRGEELKNPFENEPNDTPLTALCRTIEIDLRQQLGEQEVPSPVEPNDGVLM